MSRESARPHYDAVVDLFPLQAIPKMAYALVKFTCRICGETCEPIEAEPLFHDIRDPDIQPRLLPGSEFWPFKYAADVVVRGSAYALRGRPVTDMKVLVRVGRTRKCLQVWGNRLVTWKPNGGPGFSNPEPFTEMPLIYANAYGGADQRVPVSQKTLEEKTRLEADHPGLYPRNPFGRGYVVMPDPAPGIKLPNLENPDDLLTPERLVTGNPKRWYRQPLPQCFEYTNPLMFPRCIYLGLDAWFTPPDDQRLPEIREGLIPPRYRELYGRQFNPLQSAPPPYYQEASSGMVFQDLQKGTVISVQGMHPEEELIRFALPAEPVIVIGIEKKRRKIKPQLCNVLLEPLKKKVSLVYVARTEKLPRVFIPGIHGHIPLSVSVNGEPPVEYETPQTVRDQIRTAVGSE